MMLFHPSRSPLHAPPLPGRDNALKCRTHFRTITSKDLINLAALMDLRTALSLQHAEIKPSRYWLSGQQHPVYCLGPVRIWRRWWSHLYERDDSPGAWRICSPEGLVKKCGSDIISLEAFLRSFPVSLAQGDDSFVREIAAKHDPRATVDQITRELAERLGIDACSPTLHQGVACSGYSQVLWASPSSPAFDQDSSVENGPWPKARVARVPFIDIPHQRFEITDNQGRLQQIIGAWSTPWGRDFVLSFTLWQKDSDPLVQTWRCLRTSRKVSPFGLDRALRFPEATVLVLDDLGQAFEINEHYLTTTASPLMVAVAWPRGVTGTTPEDTDWSALKGRTVVCPVSPDKESLRLALALHQELITAEARRVTFRLAEKPCDLPSSVGDLQGLLAREEVGITELSDLARKRFGITPPEEQRRVPGGWRIGDPLPRPRPRFLLDNLLAEGSVTVLYADPGVGKTYFALLMGYAVAGGAPLLPGVLTAPTPRKVLYITSEMQEDIARRLGDIHATFGGREAPENLCLFPEPSREPLPLNLEMEESWQVMGPLVDEAALIVIDHLTNVTGGQNDLQSWQRLRVHLDRLKRRGKAILLLHHAGKNGKQRGTSVLAADVDTILRMEPLKDTANGALITFEKHRDDVSCGKNRSPVCLRWHRDENTNLLRWWTSPVADELTRPWELPPEGVEDRLNRAFIQQNFSERQAIIVEKLANTHLRGLAGLKISDIAEELEVSPSTARAELKALMEGGSIITQGEGKATRYGLAETALRDILLR